MGPRLFCLACPCQLDPCQDARERERRDVPVRGWRFFSFSTAKPAVSVAFPRISSYFFSLTDSSPSRRFPGACQTPANPVCMPCLWKAQFRFPPRFFPAFALRPRLLVRIRPRCLPGLHALPSFPRCRTAERRCPILRVSQFRNFWLRLGLKSFSPIQQGVIGSARRPAAGLCRTVGCRIAGSSYITEAEEAAFQPIPLQSPVGPPIGAPAGPQEVLHEIPILVFSLV